MNIYDILVLIILVIPAIIIIYNAGFTNVIRQLVLFFIVMIPSVILAMGIFYYMVRLDMWLKELY